VRVNWVSTLHHALAEIVKHDTYCTDVQLEI
jgi:hypothetical protein